MTPVSASRNLSPPRNRLLAALPPADFALLQPHLKPLVMDLRRDIERPNRRIETVCFMETGRTPGYSLFLGRHASSPKNRMVIA
jgi:hypothetical protein